MTRSIRGLRQEITISLLGKKKSTKKKAYFTPKSLPKWYFSAPASCGKGGGGAWDVVTQRQLIGKKEGVSTAATLQELRFLSVT